MGKKEQLEKNLKLSEKLANFVAENPKAISNVPEDASFVAFSSFNNELNKLNKQLVKSLKEEGKKVVIATEKRSVKQPWTFSATP